MKSYAELAEGEKDPRNLLLAFALDRVILLEFDVSKYIEVRTFHRLTPLLTWLQKYYDITFCYFPITFKAPANDPYGVSSASLVAALR